MPAELIRLAKDSSDSLWYICPAGTHPTYLARDAELVPAPELDGLVRRQNERQIVRVVASDDECVPEGYYLVHPSDDWLQDLVDVTGL